MMMRKKNLAANSVVESDFDELFREALRLRDAEQYKEASRLLLQCVQQRPESAAGWGVLGEVHWSQGKLKEAIRCFRRATELAPQSELASLGLFHTLWEANQRDQARVEMERFQKVAHSDEYASLARELDRPLPGKASKKITEKRTKGG